jgi:hypothetical protein
MKIHKKIPHDFYSQRLLGVLLPVASCCLSIAFAPVASAGEAVSPVGQTAPAKPAAQTGKIRPCPCFFEQERRPRFGFGDFLDSAINGADNALSSDPVQNTPSVRLQPLSRTADSPSLENPSRGILEIGINSDRSDFLQGTFISNNGSASLTFTDTQQSSTPQRGNLTMQNGSFVIINGVRTPISGRFQYNGSGNDKNDIFSGTVQLIDPNNPNQAIFIQVTPTPNQGNDDRAKGPANLSIGRPIDR